MNVHDCRRLIGVLGILVVATGGRAQEEPFGLAGPHGAAIEFGLGATGWRWTHLAAPSAPAGGWEIGEEGVEVATAEGAVVLNRGWELVERTAEKVVLAQDVAALGLRLRREFSFGPSDQALRIETWVRALADRRVLTRIGLLDVRVPGEVFRETGVAPASFPLFGQSLFLGVEHVSADCSVAGTDSDRARLQQRPRLAVDEQWQRVASVAVGWLRPEPRLPGEAGLREAFLHYLDAVRLKPRDIVLHTDTWWTVPLPLSERNLLGNIDTLRRGLQDRTGLFFDTYCVDLGWSDPRSVWAMDTHRLPNELHAVNERLAASGTRLGLWLSPGSGYPPALDNDWLAAQGYAMTPFGAGLEHVPCFALGGRYQREFKERVVQYAKQYRLGHVILDFMAHYCDVPDHGHPVGIESRIAIDAGLADVLDVLRAVNPEMVLEPMVCGYPPSPWWLTHSPFVLGPVGDDLPYGRGPSPDWMESLITARDIAYRAGQDAWLMPTQALETFDLTVLTPGEFRNMAVMAIGRGRWFLSTYFEPTLMEPDDWDFVAGLVRWARENKELLVNAWQIGGRPEDRAAYGYMFRNPTTDVYCVRNPWIEERTIELPASVVATEAREVRMIYPRRQVLGRIEPGQSGLTIALAPYETVLLTAGPVSSPKPPPAPLQPEAALVAGVPQVLPGSLFSAATDEPSRLRYYWDGVLRVPAVGGAELCVLVEGPTDLNDAECELMVGGRVVTARKVTSTGQFAAATEASPENWTWFIVPVVAGETIFSLDLNVWADQAAVGVFLRGTTPARNEPAAPGGAVFPTLQPDRRAWSQTLQPMRTLEVGSP